MKTPTYHPLCHRCEHRVLFLETGKATPRYECSQTNAVFSCYMYTPVIPVAVKKSAGDKRPLGVGWALSARVAGVKPAKVTLRAKKQGTTTVFWQEPT